MGWSLFISPGQPKMAANFDSWRHLLAPPTKITSHMKVYLNAEKKKNSYKGVRLVLSTFAFFGDSYTKRLRLYCNGDLQIPGNVFFYDRGGLRTGRLSSTNKMEKVQERVLGFINNDFTSSLQDLLSSTSTVPLHVRRMKHMATEVFKIVNDMSPEYIKDLITIQHSSYNFRRENQDSIPQVKSTRYGLRSFHYEAARIWNCLPNDSRKAECFPQFRRLLHAWNGIICKCPSCSV